MVTAIQFPRISTSAVQSTNEFPPTDNRLDPSPIQSRPMSVREEEGTTNDCNNNKDDGTYDIKSSSHQLHSPTSRPLESETLPLESSQGPTDVSEVHMKDTTGEHATTTAEESPPGPPYSTFSESVKISTILTATFAAVISPFSSSIYYPALNSLADDLHVSVSLITLTITTYLIFQGLAPSFIGNFSDRTGRRPAYIICFVIYIGANIGLALQNNYAALMVLRCLQSSGSSGTTAIGTAVVADVSTRADRGKYIGYATIAMTLGPTLGPIIGGLLDSYLGWRSIFWFLTIFAAVFLTVVVVAMPETCRAVVGNGSVPPPRWQLSVWQYLRQRSKEKKEKPDTGVPIMREGRKRLNPLASLKLAREKETGVILWYSSLLFAGYSAVLSTLSTQLQAVYGLDSLKTSLCFLPLGMGSLTSRWTVGRILDKNYRRVARAHGIPIVKNRQEDTTKYPIELARLQISTPLIYAACLVLIAYAWVMDYKTSLAGPLVMLFFTGHLATGAVTTLNVLAVDINQDTPATAMAAINLFRCLMGAGATAIANPLIDRIGIGWTGTFVAFLWALFSPSLWAVRRYGPQWRAEAHARAKAKAEMKAEKSAAADLERTQLSLEENDAR
ncbi:putative MFS transporter [Xylariaceae sp. FL0662B]|nr:putative MFS transporter [Xylariaceae sp. FL0662B]